MRKKAAPLPNPIRRFMRFQTHQSKFCQGCARSMNNRRAQKQIDSSWRPHCMQFVEVLLVTGLASKWAESRGTVCSYNVDLELVERSCSHWHYVPLAAGMQLASKLVVRCAENAEVLLAQWRLLQLSRFRKKTMCQRCCRRMEEPSAATTAAGPVARGLNSCSFRCRRLELTHAPKC